MTMIQVYATSGTFANPKALARLDELLISS
jgi:hypothetical protein